MTTNLYALWAATVAASLRPLGARLALSRAKHPSLAGHARLAQYVARLRKFRFSLRTIAASSERIVMSA